MEGTVPGVVWFIVMAVIGISISTYTICKKKNFTEYIAVYLFVTMVSYNGEALILGIFHSYAYKLGVFSDPWAENILGHILPNSTLWPATAMLVIVFSLRYRWVLLFSVLYMLLDMLFIKLGIYQHNWWRTWMTGAAIFLYCVITKQWHARLDDKRFRILRYIAFSYALWTVLYTPTIPLLLAEKQHFSAGWFENSYLDSAMFAFVYDAFLSFICIYFICILKKWYWKLVPFAFCFACDITLMISGHLFFSGGWNMFYLILLRTICLSLYIALESKYSYRPPAKQEEKA
jgi:hypothetical protein